MKKSNLLLSLVFSTLSFSGVYAQGTSSQEFNERFHSRIYGYILNGEIEFKINEVNLPEAVMKANPETYWDEDEAAPKDPSRPKNPRLKVEVSACRPKDRNVLKLASWSELKDYFRFKDKDRDLQPLVKTVVVSGEECVEVGSVVEKKSNLVGKRVPISIMKLLAAGKRSMNINDEGTYLKIDVKQGHYPFRKVLGSERIETYYMLKDLVLNKSSIDVTLDQLTGISLNVGLKMRFASSQNYPISNLITKPIPHPLFLIDVMARNIELTSLFYADSGVYEGYTIKEHTLRVLDLLHEQYDCKMTDEFEAAMAAKLKMPLKNFMQLTMSLHDIGKPQAVAAGDKHRQHEFTRPLMNEAFKELGFSKEARSVALELTDNDAIGDYLKGSINLSRAQKELEDQARKTVLTKAEFFKLQMIFYTADAGSYPGLFSRVFNEDPQTCCITPQAPKFQALEDKMLAP